MGAGCDGIQHPRRTYRFDFAVTGRKGAGQGSVNFTVLSQSGPPLALSWAIGSLLLIGLLILVGIAWWRVRPRRHLLSL